MRSLRLPSLPPALVLILILLAGLLLRLGLAPLPGNEFDVGVNQGWGKSAVHLGLARSYVEQLDGNMLPNYAPLTLILFAGAAHVQHLLFGLDAHPLAYRLIIKLPAIFADLLTALFFFFLLRRWRDTRTGLLGALAYALHPAVWYNSAVWGQTDSIFSMFLVLGAGCFVWRQHTLSGVNVALAIFSKMQAVALLPLYAFLYIRDGWRTLTDATFGGLLVATAVLLPFVLGGTLQNVIDVYLHSVGYYSVVSSAAYNLWWSLLADAAGTTQDTTLLFGLLSYRHTGFVLFGLSTVAALWILRRHLRAADRLQALPAVFLAATFLFHAFFMLNTQMHERYLFPFVALGIPMLFLGSRPRWIYVSISALFFLNLLGWLPATAIDRGLYQTFHAFDVLIASLQVVLFVNFLLYLRRFAATTPPPPRPDPHLRIRWPRLFPVRRPPASDASEERS